MGLTDREKQIIAEMERALSTEDPRLAATLEQSGRPRIGKNIALILCGIALILSGVIAKLAILGIAGFLVALAGAATIRIGKVDIKSKSPKGNRIQDRWDRRNQ
jgi:Flp pilus assembly protein TadB